jgi:ribosomal protein L12E/L44/L45/RPP1/RPP2
VLLKLVGVCLVHEAVFEILARDFESLLIQAAAAAASSQQPTAANSSQQPAATAQQQQQQQQQQAASSSKESSGSFAVSACNLLRLRLLQAETAKLNRTCARTV